MKRLLCIGLLAFGCGGNADVEGTYTINLTNRDNGCNFSNWTVGMANTVTVAINQESENVSADVMGVARVFLDAGFGGHVFTGKVDGDEVDLLLIGDRSSNTGNCAYTFDARILATADGDVLRGTISYTPKTNGHADCASIEGCRTYQEFNGTRPPR